MMDATAHVVVVPSTSSGHAIPFLQFARRLAAAGIVTTVVTSDRHVLELEKLVGSADRTAQGEPLRLLGLRDKQAHLSHDEWTRQVREVPEVREAVIRLLQEAVTDVASLQSRQLRGVPPAAPPACVVHDMFTPWAQEAAVKLHIDKHLFYVSSASLLSLALQVGPLSCLILVTINVSLELGFQFPVSDFQFRAVVTSVCFGHEESNRWRLVVCSRIGCFERVVLQLQEKLATWFFQTSLVSHLFQH